jgi:hypothetical protein
MRGIALDPQPERNPPTIVCAFAGVCSNHARESDRTRVGRATWQQRASE